MCRNDGIGQSEQKQEWEGGARSWELGGSEAGSWMLGLEASGFGTVGRTRHGWGEDHP
jgi:hypothetical protein